MICPYTISSDFSDQVLPACSCLGSMPAATNYTQKLWTCGDLLTTGSDLDRDSPCRADYTDQSPMEPLYACFEEKNCSCLLGAGHHRRSQIHKHKHGLTQRPITSSFDSRRLRLYPLRRTAREAWVKPPLKFHFIFASPIQAGRSVREKNLPPVEGGRCFLRGMY